MTLLPRIPARLAAGVALALGSALLVAGPAPVGAGGDLPATVVSSPDQVPATVSGLPLTEVKNFRLVFPIPANSTLVSASLSGGEGLGGEPVLTVEGDDVVVTLDASLAGGATYTLP